jgi:hypothetical protein
MVFAPSPIWPAPHHITILPFDRAFPSVSVILHKATDKRKHDGNAVKCTCPRCLHELAMHMSSKQNWSHLPDQSRRISDSSQLKLSRCSGYLIVYFELATMLFAFMSGTRSTMALHAQHGTSSPENLLQASTHGLAR